MYTTISLLFFFFANLKIISATTLQAKEALYDDLLTGYHQYLRPGSNQSLPTTLMIHFSVIALKEFDEKTGRFTVTGYFTFQWTDERMSWDPNNYNGTTKISIPQKLVWVPLLLMANPFDEMPGHGEPNQGVSFFSSGGTVWMPGNIYDTFCTAHIEYYPFDIQKCSFLFSPWGYNPQEISMVLISDRLDYSTFTPNGKWNITESSLSIQTYDHFQTLTIDFSFVRRSQFDVVNTIIPILLLEVMLMLVFLIPVESGERIGYATTMLLAVTVYMTIISDRLPDVSHPSISYFSYFLATDIILGFLLVIFLVYSLNIHHTPVDKEFSGCWKCLLRLCTKRIKIKDESTSEKVVTWQEIASVYDKTCAAIFMFLNIIKAITVFSILVGNEGSSNLKPST